MTGDDELRELLFSPSHSPLVVGGLLSATAATTNASRIASRSVGYGTPYCSQRSSRQT